MQPTGPAIINSDEPVKDSGNGDVVSVAGAATGGRALHSSGATRMTQFLLSAAEEQDGASGTTILVILGAVALVLYIGSLYLHPLTRCGRCKGSPRHYGALATKSWRNCGACNGSGRETRLGARILGIEP
ncbi:hypothetical protein [Pseudonocardia sp. UM4_GMWB1]|jgi:hypothetical protein|nr:hypothetical protein [Pseudonocardia sp. SID8383]MYW75898.1 hypothetical protein [Pseudonocardia sp. SID8383]